MLISFNSRWEILMSQQIQECCTFPYSPCVACSAWPPGKYCTYESTSNPRNLSSEPLKDFKLAYRQFCVWVSSVCTVFLPKNSIRIPDIQFLVWQRWVFSNRIFTMPSPCCDLILFANVTFKYIHPTCANLTVFYHFNVSDLIMIMNF